MVPVKWDQNVQGNTMILISKKNTILSSSVYSNQQTHNLDLAVCTLIRFRHSFKDIKSVKRFMWMWSHNSVIAPA